MKGRDMKSLRNGVIGSLVLTAVLVGAQDLGDLKTLLLNRTDENHKAVGIVVGLVDATGERFLAAGATAPGGKVAPDADTVFEIGSITKVFTSLVLADMVGRGEVKLDDPVAKFLPPTVKVPERDGRQVTLIDLSNQVSGLPRMPDNFKPADMGDPYIDYGPPQLYEFLSRYQLPRAIGEKYEYSNLGVGLLGHALALRAGMSYEELVRRRVLEPLGMTDTAITLPERLKARLAAGTGPNLSPVKNWNFDAIAAAGALRSTARDMLKFLGAAMGLRDTPLRAAFDLMIKTERQTGTPDLTIGMAWHIWRKYGTEIVWHNGGTGGYRSWAGFAPDKKAGVVVLCNTSFGVDDLGCWTLEPKWPVARFKPTVARAAIELDEKALQAFAGEYQLEQGVTVVITLSGGKLHVKAPGQAEAIYLAWSPTEFFRPGGREITFYKDASGAVTGFVLYSEGLDHEAKKIK
jgi:D-alanyl-D-alanine-carboxypeptidase/D-alanyl-D-alanine-endopeptidase